MPQFSQFWALVAIAFTASSPDLHHSQETSMNRRYEPPFDGKPCPMCPTAIRNLSAVVHNFLWRWKEFIRCGDGCKVRDKFERVQWAVQDVESLIAPETHEAVRALHAEAAEFVARFNAWLAKEEGALDRVREQTEKLQAASDAIKALSDAHFADRMHSHGEVPR
jgi:hypothetical protein